MIDWSDLSNAATQVGDGLSTKLEQMILDGTLPDGERLPSERELATTLGCSRTSLRDALRDLQLKGLIERRPGRGTIVIDPKGRKVGSGFLGKMDGEDRAILEIMDLRSVVEPPIAARAARRATTKDIAAMRNILKDMEQASVEDAADLDVAFHSRIAQATHNPILVELVEDASKWIDQTRRDYLLSEERLAKSIAAHREILDAIESRDDAAAADAMRRHIAGVDGLLGEGE